MSVQPSGMREVSVKCRNYHKLFKRNGHTPTEQHVAQGSKNT